jgi:hypothetical protein
MWQQVDAGIPHRIALRLQGLPANPCRDCPAAKLSAALSDGRPSYYIDVPSTLAEAPLTNKRNQMADHVLALQHAYYSMFKFLSLEKQPENG